MGAREPIASSMSFAQLGGGHRRLDIPFVFSVGRMVAILAYRTPKSLPPIKTMRESFAERQRCPLAS